MEQWTAPSKLIPRPITVEPDGTRSRQKYLVEHDQRFWRGDFGRVELTDNGPKEMPQSTNFIAQPPSLSPRGLDPSLRLRAESSYRDDVRHHDAAPMTYNPALWKASSPRINMVRTGPTQEHGLETCNPMLSPWWFQVPQTASECVNRTPTPASLLPSPALAHSEFQRTAAQLHTVGSPRHPRDARVIMQAARLTPRFQEEFSQIRSRLQMAQNARVRHQTGVAAALS